MSWNKEDVAKMEQAIEQVAQQLWVCWLSVQIKDLGVKAGVVLNPATPIEAIQHVITQVDLILLMSGKHFCHALVAH